MNASTTTSATDVREKSLHTLAQLGPRLTDDVIGIRIDLDGLHIQTYTHEHAVELAYLVGTTEVDTKHSTYITPDGREFDSLRTTRTNVRDRVTILHIEQTPTGRTRDICCEVGVCADPVGPADVKDCEAGS